MELGIFWGLVRLVEGVPSIALENCLSLLSQVKFKQ